MNMRLLLVALVCAICGYASIVDAGNLTVTTDKGQVLGYSTADGSVDTWLGIPYAAPPVGALRFAVPQEAAAWSGVRAATTSAPICVQMSTVVTGGQEDCLYVDVYSPANRTAPLPVMVWIYGGTWMIGDASYHGLYNGSNLARAHNMLVVSFNYRLGVLGFLANPAARSENPAGSVGSYGIYDAVAALEWVQRNIAAFGGDPTQVTIAGESAGAFSVCVLLASPLSKGLFRGAIMESGSCSMEYLYTKDALNYAWSENWAAHAGCANESAAATLACLRAMPVSALVAVSPEMTWSGYQPLYSPSLLWSVTIDGVLLADVPTRAIAAGNGVNVSVLAGSNLNEGTMFVTFLPARIPGLTYKFGDMTLLANYMYGNNATATAAVVAAYPDSSFATAREQLLRAFADYFYRCSTSRVLLAQTSSTQQPTWLYHFVFADQEQPLNVLLGPAFHSSEIELVFSNPGQGFDPKHIGTYNFTLRQQIMANTMGVYWSNFVKYQNPNGPAGATPTLPSGVPLPVWPAYEPKNLTGMELDLPPSTVQAAIEPQCRMWSSLAPYVPVNSDSPSSGSGLSKCRGGRRNRKCNRRSIASSLA